MDRNRYTESGLPKVSTATWEVLDRDWSKRDDEGTSAEFDREIEETLGREDEVLGGILSSIVDRCREKDEVRTRLFKVGFLYAYELLRRQGATYELEGDVE
jgi:hypothetical protein